MTTNTVVMGFDVGLKKIGIAVGQLITQSANPIAVVATIQQQPDWLAIEKLVATWRPHQFVVGLPTQADGELGKVGKAVLQFKAELQQRFGNPVHLIDEHLSTEAAKSYVAHTKIKTHPLGIDAIAATIILENWLKTQ